MVPLAKPLCVNLSRKPHVLSTICAVLLLGLGSTAFAATLCVSPGGKHSCYPTISAAVTAASPGDVIAVYPGTYREQVNIAKPLSLISKKQSAAIIDATGKANGIFIDGMGAAPNAGVTDVVVSGFTIRNADFEGILIANASNVTIVQNVVAHNNRALNTSTLTCPGIPAFETNEGEDCGEGIHLMAADHASIVRNEVEWNSGGILTSDETGPSRDNVINENFVHDNPFDCGITMASHAPAVSIIPSAGLPYGVMRNTVAGNRSWHNGAQQPGAGAGIGIFAPFPGTTDAENVVVGNDVRDNGLPGITMHNHAYSPMAPPVNMNDNVIIGNFLSGNAADTADAATGGPTGINIYSVAPITGTMVLQNRFEDEAYDLVFKAPSGQVNAHFNNFDEGVGVDNMGTGTVSATENWWDCPSGPGNGNCAEVQGSGVAVTPWLYHPFTPSEDDDRH
jgi:nitrous oxidase accessory protein NosD